MLLWSWGSGLLCLCVGALAFPFCIASPVFPSVASVAPSPCSPPPETVASCNSPLSLSKGKVVMFSAACTGGVRIPITRTHLVRERLVSPWATVGPRFDSQNPRVSGAGARWPAGVSPLVSFDVGGAWRLFACRHGRLQALPFRNFIGCYPRIEWSLLPLVFNTPPDWVASVTISLSLSQSLLSPLGRALSVTLSSPAGARVGGSRRKPPHAGLPTRRSECTPGSRRSWASGPRERERDRYRPQMREIVTEATQSGGVLRTRGSNDHSIRG